MTGADVAAVLAGLGEAGRHLDVVVWPKGLMVVLGGVEEERASLHNFRCWGLA